MRRFKSEDARRPPQVLPGRSRQSALRRFMGNDSGVPDPGGSYQRPQGISPQMRRLGIAGGVVVGIGVLAWLAAKLGMLMAGVSAPSNPFELLFAVLNGQARWPAASTTIALAFAAVAVSTAALALRARTVRRHSRTRVDAAARHMGTGQDIAGLQEATVKATAARLGITDQFGLMIGVSVATGERLWSSWEDVAVILFGPRQGKTTSWVIPRIVSAPGAVVATSNKRDIVDGTRDVRAKRGQLWVFDPQSIVGEQATWWWNPLSFVTSHTTAAQLAGIFADAGNKEGARTDAYFDSASRTLLTNMLLAAALDERPLNQVALWLNDANDDEPAEILKRHGQQLPAASLTGTLVLPDPQKLGLYDTASNMVSFLLNDAISPWIISDGSARPHFDPHQFVRSTGTLYSMSKEGAGSAGAVTAALTIAVMEAAMQYAQASPSGRLPVPLLAELDEVANVCRWSELPNQFSFYGSHGICVDAILQNYSQGAGVWGDRGMEQLYSLATVRMIGSGLADTDFLRKVSDTIGDFKYTDARPSRGEPDQRSLSRERIFEVSDLVALPKGRAVVISAGNRATLVRTIPWMVGEHADAISASVRAHDPAGARTLADAAHSVEQVAAGEAQTTRNTR